MAPKYTADTTLYGVFGHPVGHSLSPAMQNAAFAACGIDALYLAFDVAPARLPAAVEAIHALGLGGANITVPHKRAVVPLLDATAGDAAASGSVNTIVREHGRSIGHSTDGEGFVRALRDGTGWAGLSGRRVCILGAGGAAIAIAVRLVREGIGALVVVTRDTNALAWPEAALTAGVTKTKTRIVTYADLAAAAEALAGFDLLINATPLGMSPREDTMPPVPDAVLVSGLVVCDLVYRPERTRLMRAAELRGAAVIGGLGMLVHQGAIAFTLWTGRPAPLGEMRSAAIQALSL